MCCGSFKLAPTLAPLPLPIEAIPLAAALVGRQAVSMCGSPTIRQGITTDNGNILIGIVGLRYSGSYALETELSHPRGGLCNGVFADGVRTYESVPA